METPPNSTESLPSPGRRTSPGSRSPPVARASQKEWEEGAPSPLPELRVGRAATASAVPAKVTRTERVGSAPMPTVLQKRATGGSLVRTRKKDDSVRGARGAAAAGGAGPGGEESTVVVRMQFPESFPQVHKQVRLELGHTVQEAVYLVEGLLRFPVPKIEGVRLAVPAAVWAGGKGPELERLRKARQGPFLDPGTPLLSYRALLRECGEQLEFRYSGAGEPTAVKHKGHIDARQSVDLSALINPANPKKLFRNLKQIGAGGFADVCSAWDADDQRVVVKKIRITNLNLKYVLEEVINHKSSTHPNIVAFLDCFFVLEDQELWVALEYMPNGTLTSRLTMAIPEPEMARILRSVAAPCS
jgi:hypothetical protein